MSNEVYDDVSKVFVTGATVDRLHDVEEGDGRRRPGQPVAAPRTGHRFEESGTRHRLQVLGQIRRRDAVELRQPPGGQRRPGWQHGQERSAVHPPLDPF